MCFRNIPKLSTYFEEIKEHTYDLKSRGQGCMIQVSIHATVPLKEFDYNAEVKIINSVADDIILKTKQEVTPHIQNQQHQKNQLSLYDLVL